MRTSVFARSFQTRACPQRKPDHAHIHELSHRTMRGSDTCPLVSLHGRFPSQLFGRMMRTSGEFDPIVVSAIQKLRCEHQTYPPTRGGSSPWRGACRLLVRLDGGNEPLVIGPPDLSDSLTLWGGLRQTFSQLLDDTESWLSPTISVESVLRKRRGRPGQRASRRLGSRSRRK